MKQHLAAVRMLFDRLVVGQVVAHNPASAVRGPWHSAVKGKTHMPSREEAKALLAAIDTGNLVGLRDRALIGTLLYTFARVGAALIMQVRDYYPVGKRWWVRLHEKVVSHHVVGHDLRLPDRPMLDTAGIVARDAKGRAVHLPLIEWTDRKTGYAFTRALLAAIEAAHPGAVL